MIPVTITHGERRTSGSLRVAIPGQGVVMVGPGEAVTFHLRPGERADIRCIDQAEVPRPVLVKADEVAVDAPAAAAADAVASEPSPEDSAPATGVPSATDAPVAPAAGEGAEA